MKGIIICSGGLDSTVLYYFLKDKGYDLIPINFSYGSKHNRMEREVAEKLFPNLKEIDIDLSFLNSSLMISSDQSIPEGSYKEESMKSTIVPFRNGIMISYAVAFASNMNIEEVFIGAHTGDHFIYPDCRKKYISKMDDAAWEGAGVRVLAPFNNYTKADIVTIGAKIGIEDIMSNTYSCYNGGNIHCGKCGTCMERKEAFILSGVKDNTLYKE